MEHSQITYEFAAISLKVSSLFLMAYWSIHWNAPDILSLFPYLYCDIRDQDLSNHLNHPMILLSLSRKSILKTKQKMEKKDTFHILVTVLI